MKAKQTNAELKLWLRIVLIALILLGAGVILALILSGDPSQVFEKFLEANWILLAAALLLILAGAFGLFYYNRKKNPPVRSSRKWDMKELVVGALCIGLAFVLSYIRIFHMPQGGSITPASMLPIMLFAYIYGTPHGLIVGIASGLLQVLQDAYVIHWAQLFMDYIFAFGSLALAGLFRKHLLPGVILGGLGRFVFAFLSGAIFFGEYAPAGVSPFIYSLGYQASYLLPDLAICVLVVLIPGIRKNVQQLQAAARPQKKVSAA